MSNCIIVLLQSAELSSLTNMAHVLCRRPLAFPCTKRSVSPRRRRRQSKRGMPCVLGSSGPVQVT